MKKGLIALLVFSALNWAFAGAPAKGPKEDKGGGQEKAVRQETASEKGKSQSQAKSQEEPKAEKERVSAEGKGKGGGKTEEPTAVSAEKKKTAEEGLDKGKGKAEEMKGRGKEHAQQAAAVQKQLVHEEQKHLQRRARIQRILELAREKGDEKAAARAQALLDKEQKRFDKKHTRMIERGGLADEPASEAAKKPMPKREKKSGGRAAEETENEE